MRTIPDSARTHTFDKGNGTAQHRVLRKDTSELLLLLWRMQVVTKLDISVGNVLQKSLLKCCRLDPLHCACVSTAIVIYDYREMSKVHTLLSHFTSLWFSCHGGWVDITVQYQSHTTAHTEAEPSRQWATWHAAPVLEHDFLLLGLVTICNCWTMPLSPTNSSLVSMRS